MFSRNLFKHGICVTSALALLVAVMTSPIRPSRSNPGLSYPNYLRRNYSIPPTDSTRPSPTSITSLQVRVKALRSEDEKKLVGTTRLARCPFDLPPHPSLTPPRDLSTVGPLRASHPLRC
jgi:hypothetical protein